MQINREQRAGKLRLDAWQAMAQRSKLQEIDGFVNMLMQTERFGTPIARALSSYGDGIRLKRRQRAEELAAKTTVKIIFPLVLFIFPAMFIVLLGPAGINIAKGLAQSGNQLHARAGVRRRICRCVRLPLRGRSYLLARIVRSCYARYPTLSDKARKDGPRELCFTAKLQSEPAPCGAGSFCGPSLLAMAPERRACDRSPAMQHWRGFCGAW